MTRFTEPDFFAGHAERQHELSENLVVQVGNQQQGIIFTFAELHLPGPVHVEGRKHDGTHENENKTRQREKFVQAEWFCLFIQRGRALARFNNLSVSGHKISC